MMPTWEFVAGKRPASIAGIARGGSFFLKTGEKLPCLV
jgi:hypothetical protein